MYDVILADPPWRYNRDDLGKDPKMGGFTYDTMSDQELYDLPMQNIANKNSLLFLWATMPKLPEALKCIEAWGYRYSTTAFVWVKLNRRGFMHKSQGQLNTDKVRLYNIVELWGGVYSGLGRWTNQNVEIVLLGKRGTFPRESKSVKQLLFAPLQDHSRKPRDVFSRIDHLVGYDKKKIELFARDVPPENWDATGLEYDQTRIQDFLARPNASEKSFIS